MKKVVIKSIDTQIEKWIIELNELYERREGVEKAIADIEECINIARKSANYIRNG